MTINELIDRLKTAEDKNNDVHVILRSEDGCFIARHVVEAIEIGGDVFIDVIERGELIVSSAECVVLKPNRKEQEPHPLETQHRRDFTARMRAEAACKRLNGEHRKEDA